jgi:hypothetical protein
LIKTGENQPVLKVQPEQRSANRPVWFQAWGRLLFESEEFPFSKHQFRYGNKFWKNVAQLVFNCPLLPTPQNNLAGKWPMTQKFLVTPLPASNDRQCVDQIQSRVKRVLATSVTCDLNIV